MSFLVPSSPPSNVTAVSNDASSIDVSWNEVPSPDQNGVITGYLLFYRESSATTYTNAATMQLKLNVQGLFAATSYSLRVLAYNSNGNGIASELITLTTREKGSIINDSDDEPIFRLEFNCFKEIYDLHNNSIHSLCSTKSSAAINISCSHECLFIVC